VKKDVPHCTGCPFVSKPRRAKRTGNNDTKRGPRGSCMCNHPEAVATFNKVRPRSPRMAAFIGYTRPGGNVPQIKTSPKWCPLRFNTDK